MKNRGDENQLSLFDTYVPDNSTKKINELDESISSNMNIDDLDKAKNAVKEQEKLLKKVLEKKKS